MKFPAVALYSNLYVSVHINTCLLRIRSTPGVRCTLWPSSRNGGFSPFAIARKYLTR